MITIINNLSIITCNSGKGPIRMLTNIRCFGYCFNPVTIYYCFSLDGYYKYYINCQFFFYLFTLERTIDAVILDVSNTPWLERYQYILNLADEKQSSRIDSSSWRCIFKKKFHVSPFMDMNHLVIFFFNSRDFSN